MYSYLEICLIVFYKDDQAQLSDSNPNTNRETNPPWLEGNHCHDKVNCQRDNIYNYQP